MIKKSDDKTQFMYSLQTLAQPASVQIDMTQESTGVGEHLISQFDNSFKTFKARFYSSMSALQRGRIRELTAYIEKLSHKPNPIFWSEPSALFEDARWEEIRKLAQGVLSAFDWENQRPPKTKAGE